MFTSLRLGRISAAVIACAVMASGSKVAAQAGVGQDCGGPAGPNCTVGLFCEVAPGKCNEDDPTGQCIVRTEACTKIYKPVCGCDGTTYANDCMRIAAAARKDHDGECKG